MQKLDDGQDKDKRKVPPGATFTPLDHTKGPDGTALWLEQAVTIVAKIVTSTISVERQRTIL